ncbi:MAG TPA: hypothetical protein VGY91_03435 [Chthoniobacterales bacterium]|jgi:hypothetical protein|nr:hypothetical protein [Chthoniobacterales bacterium]
MRRTRQMIRDLFGSKTVQDLLDEARGETDSCVRDRITQGPAEERGGIDLASLAEPGSIALSASLPDAKEHAR